MWLSKRKHRSLKKDQVVTDRILLSTIEVGLLIAEEITQWLKIIHSRLSQRMKAVNLWTIKFSRYMSMYKTYTLGFGIILQASCWEVMSYFVKICQGKRRGRGYIVDHARKNIGDQIQKKAKWCYGNMPLLVWKRVWLCV